MKHLLSVVAFATLLPLSALAQNSAPQPAPFVDTVPEARDIPYPGTLQLDVDAERALDE